MASPCYLLLTTPHLVIFLQTRSFFIYLFLYFYQYLRGKKKKEKKHPSRGKKDCGPDSSWSVVVLDNLILINSDGE